MSRREVHLDVSSKHNSPENLEYLDFFSFILAY